MTSKAISCSSDLRRVSSTESFGQKKLFSSYSLQIPEGVTPFRADDGSKSKCCWEEDARGDTTGTPATDEAGGVSR